MEIGLHLIRMFLEMLFQYIIYIVAYRQLPFTGNPYNNGYFLVQFLVYIYPLSAFAFVGCKELADIVGQCRANRFR